jgi:hypothetical protein
LEISDAGMTVVAGRGGVRLGRLRYDGGKKTGAAEVAAAAGIEKGTRLGQ